MSSTILVTLDTSLKILSRLSSKTSPDICKPNGRRSHLHFPQRVLNVIRILLTAYCFHDLTAHAKTLTPHLTVWSKRCQLTLVGCHLWFCCTTGFNVSLYLDLSDPSTNKESHLISSQEQLSLSILYALWLLQWHQAPTTVLALSGMLVLNLLLPVLEDAGLACSHPLTEYGMHLHVTYQCL